MLRFLFCLYLCLIFLISYFTQNLIKIIHKTLLTSLLPVLGAHLSATRLVRAELLLDVVPGLLGALLEVVRLLLKRVEFI